MEKEINKPKKRMSLAEAIVLPLAIGVFGVGSFALGWGAGDFFRDRQIKSNKIPNHTLDKVVEFKTGETLKNIPQSTYYFYPEDNWSYGIDIERNGKEDIKISDPYKRIKEIMPVERGYKIILNTNEERKNFNEILESLKNETH